MKRFIKWAAIIVCATAMIGTAFGDTEETTDTEEAQATAEQAEQKEQEAAEAEKEKAEKEKAEKEKAEKEKAEKEKAEKEKAEKEQAEKEKAAKEKEKAQAEKEKKEQAEAEKAAEKKKQESQKQLENEFLTILEESMAGVARVEFDRENKTYRLYPTDPGMKAVVGGLTQGQYLEEWATMTEQLRTLGGSAQQFLGDGYSLQLANPANEENILIIILNDKVIYNAVDDL